MFSRARTKFEKSLFNRQNLLETLQKPTKTKKPNISFELIRASCRDQRGMQFQRLTDYNDFRILDKSANCYKTVSTNMSSNLGFVQVESN